MAQQWRATRNHGRPRSDDCGTARGRPFRFIWNKSQAIAANVYLLLYPKEPVARRLKAEPDVWEDLFRTLQSIHADQFRAEGRVYGGGLFKMEPAELMRLPADELAALLHWKREEQLAFLGAPHRFIFPFPATPSTTS